MKKNEAFSRSSISSPFVASVCGILSVNYFFTQFTPFGQPLENTKQNSLEGPLTLIMLVIHALLIERERESNGEEQRAPYTTQKKKGKLE